MRRRGGGHGWTEAKERVLRVNAAARQRLSPPRIVAVWSASCLPSGLWTVVDTVNGFKCFAALIANRFSSSHSGFLFCDRSPSPPHGTKEYRIAAEMDRGRSQWNNRFAGIRTPGNFFGGTDPFDDPFFTQPFGSLMGPSLFDRSLFAPTGNPFCESPFSFFMEDQQPPPKRSRGPIIEELPSDDEEQINIPRKCNNPSKESYIEKPDKGTEYSIASSSKPQTRSYSFHSSTVTYGGPGGAYYTSSTTRRTGGDGVTVEESKKADTTTRRATHRISRGLGDKGHSVTRKLNPDGRVDTVQTLHNINEDELPDFEEAWKDDARRHLPGWESGLNVLHDGSREGRHSASRGRALPAVMPQASSRPGPSSMGRP